MAIKVRSYKPYKWLISALKIHILCAKIIGKCSNIQDFPIAQGHASLQMTMDLYCHVTDDTLYKEMQKMEQVV